MRGGAKVVQLWCHGAFKRLNLLRDAWHQAWRHRSVSGFFGFLQTDPIGYADDYNLYAYVGNDPVNRADPSGLWGCSETRFTVCDGDRGSQTVPNDGTDPEEQIRRQLKKAADNNGGRASPPSCDTCGPHHYDMLIPLCFGCSRKDAFDVARCFSAPGAPCAADGTHTVTLTLNNPIRQVVDSKNFTILNETMQGHYFYYGTVRLEVVDNSGEVSLHVVGNGINGAHAEDNQISGPVIFFGLGLAASLILNPWNGN